MQVVEYHDKSQGNVELIMLRFHDIWHHKWQTALQDIAESVEGVRVVEISFMMTI